MSRLLGIILLAFGFSFWATAQDVKQNQKKAQEIQGNSKYYWGIGSGDTEYSAGQAAMQDLVGNISTHVTGQFDVRTENLVDGQNISSKMATENVLRTYTSGHIQDVKTLLLTKNAPFRVMRYLTVATFDSIMNLRKYRIEDYMRMAMEAEEKGYIDDALKNYYWGLCLLKSLKNPSNVLFSDKKHGIENRVLINWIDQQMNDIFGKLKATITEVDQAQAKLMITYDGNPVPRVEFKYHDGRRWSSPETAKDGMGLIQMVPGYEPENVQIHYEFEFTGLASTDSELSEVLEIYKGTPFKHASAIIPKPTKKEMKSAMKQFEAAAQEQASPTDAFMKRSKEYTTKVLEIAEAIKSEQFDAVRDYFTEYGYHMYDSLLHYGHAAILTIPELHCYEFLDKIVCRSIPMKFTFKEARRDFIEDVNFTFNKDGKIESLAFGLDKPTRDQIYSEKNLTAWGDSTCHMLAAFLENYQTAFALKRLDYINAFFADYATIVTGTVTRPAKKDRSSGAMSAKEQQLVQYTTQDKEQYIKNLKKTFAGNSYINIKFADATIEKMNDRAPGVQRFAINIHQDYCSTKYCDSGFLFLMLDASNINWPIIQYRTWQAERDEKFTTKLMRKNIEEARQLYKFWGLMNVDLLD
ncbi:MAG: hypothetical protein J6W75_06905 [Bacteroidaceae bacterium]|nr:hypothetical protein [Bacteroidaceae bacterium]